jgi:flagellar protein FlaF
MYKQAAQAYSRINQTTASPREVEAMLLSQAAARFAAIQGDWENSSGELEAALNFNRKIWTVLATSVVKPENPLPEAIKKNVASLAVFILSHTVSLMARPAPEGLNVFISINQNIAAGLRTPVTAAPAEVAAAAG